MGPRHKLRCLRINKYIVTVIAYRYNSSQNKQEVFLTVVSGGPNLSRNIANHALPRVGDSAKFFSNDSLILKMTQASTRCFTNNDHLLNLHNVCLTQSNVFLEMKASLLFYFFPKVRQISKECNKCDKRWHLFIFGGQIDLCESVGSYHIRWVFCITVWTWISIPTVQALKLDLVSPFSENYLSGKFWI